MRSSPFEWQRGPRATFPLTREAGVYALFLRAGSVLPGVEAGEQGLLYIGLAANQDGLEGRCHFHARTGNHSPRKSLAVMLTESLELTPVLITKPNGRHTWGLDGPSEARLSEWMHDHLELAVETCADPDAREAELLLRYAPPLNLKKCAQSLQHRQISAARAEVMTRLRGQTNPPVPARVRHESLLDPSVAARHRAELEPVSFPARHFVGSELDTADRIADRFGLNRKSYRQRLRNSVAWYRKPQDWTFPVGSNQWRDMIAVAEMMAG